MNDERSTTPFDAEEIGRIHAQELVNTLISEYQTADEFAHARAQARQALLEYLDAVDPLQAIESARQSATAEERQRQYTDESAQRRKDRGSNQDPLFPPNQPKRWD